MAGQEMTGREVEERLQRNEERLEEQLRARIDRIENILSIHISDQRLVNQLREQLDYLREIFDDLSEDDNTSETGSLSSSESSRVGDVDSNQQVVKRNSAEHRANDQENGGEVELEEDLVEPIHCNHNNNVAG